MMTLTSPIDIWNYMKKEYSGDERIRGMKVLNLMSKFKLWRMKESETSRNTLTDCLVLSTRIVIFFAGSGTKETYEAKEMVNGEFVASHKTQNNDKFVKYYPPCQHSGKNGHPPYKSLKRPDAQWKNCKQLGHEAVICKIKFQKDEVVAQVTTEEKKKNTYLWQLVFQPKNLIFGCRGGFNLGEGVSCDTASSENFINKYKKLKIKKINNEQIYQSNTSYTKNERSLVG
ncbi:uncharacterized protein LOC107006700 [Solanum pennellii]|uniref:Uncharacterized protein LOC107006700 n=1 Tax=Solanum pennellii TaxID=28526 RepID=A0ABM1FRJ4_SOLPN|nr:uncharacterized protein LOC107006700 [Solanum pennellii]